MFRSVSEQEQRSPYAQRVRLRLAKSGDTSVLAQTALKLEMWGNPSGPCVDNAGVEALELAQQYSERAVSIQPTSKVAQAARNQVDQIQLACRGTQLERMSPAELLRVSDSDRMLLTLRQMLLAWIFQNIGDAAAKARQLLQLAKSNQKDKLYGDAIFEANMVLGKAALRQGDSKAADRYLRSAAETPGSGKIWLGQFEMNLPRALVDQGERRTVADFFEHMAPKTLRSKRFNTWAEEIRNGINPDLLPTLSTPGCSKDPC